MAMHRYARWERTAAVLVGDLTLVRCFAGACVPVVLATPDRDDPASYSRHVVACHALPSAPLDADAIVDGLLAVGHALRDPVLIYGDDALLRALARRREAVARRFRVLLPRAGVLDALLDKCAFAELARAHGLPTPPSIVVDERTSADAIVREVGLPLVLKPGTHVGFRQATGGRKVLFARTRAELDAALERMRALSPTFVAQSEVPGGEDEIHSYHAFVAEGGEVLAEHGGRKIRTYPRRGGASTLVEIVEAGELAPLGRDVIARLGLVGPLKLDFKRDARRGGFSLLEVNARFNLWNYPGAIAGVNLPLVAYAYLTGAPLPALRPLRKGVRWLALGDDARAFAREYRPAGELSVAGWLRSVAAADVYEVFAWDDPAPALVDVAQWIAARTRSLFA
ncbi:MAG TPA: ATP-grasp domain-containing protein [Minicystis sp.]|nr:ATP-grasp domain-containing protein [Minicystis sp.]